MANAQHQLGAGPIGQPLPPGPAQDLALKSVTDELADRGFVVAQLDKDREVVGADVGQAAQADEGESGVVEDVIQRPAQQGYCRERQYLYDES